MECQFCGKPIFPVKDANGFVVFYWTANERAGQAAHSADRNTCVWHQETAPVPMAHLPVGVPA